MKRVLDICTFWAFVGVIAAGLTLGQGNFDKAEAKSAHAHTNIEYSNTSLVPECVKSEHSGRVIAAYISRANAKNSASLLLGDKISIEEKQKPGYWYVLAHVSGNIERFVNHVYGDVYENGVENMYAIGIDNFISKDKFGKEREPEVINAHFVFALSDLAGYHIDSPIQFWNNFKSSSPKKKEEMLNINFTTLTKVHEDLAKWSINAYLIHSDRYGKSDSVTYEIVDGLRKKMGFKKFKI